MPAKALGIVRKVDDLGRIVIPMEIRKQRGWNPGAHIEILATEEGVLLRNYLPVDDKSRLLKDLKRLKSFPLTELEREEVIECLRDIEKGEK